jgi:hypothetical protein
VPKRGSSQAVTPVRKAVEDRLQELAPLVSELERLQGVLARLDGGDVPKLAAATWSGQRAAPPTARAVIRRHRQGTKPGRDGRAPQGYNKQRIVEIVLADPGVTATEIAEQTGLKRTVVSATISRMKRTGELEARGAGVRVPLSEPQS